MDDITEARAARLRQRQAAVEAGMNAASQPPDATSIDAMLDSWTKHHPPGSPDVVAAHEKIRTAVRALLVVFAQAIPDCPDRTYAMRKAVEAMWAGNAAVACNHPDNHVLDLS